MASEVNRTFSFAALNDVVVLAGAPQVTGAQTIALQSKTGWGTLTIIVEGSLDPAGISGEWVTVAGQDATAGTLAASITAASKLVRFDVTGLTNVRLRCSSFGSGTGTIWWEWGAVGIRV